MGTPRHGHSSVNGKPKPSLTYSSWKNMVARCTQKSSPAYAHYRSRGITMCERWRCFENFLSDMGERPSREFTLDRIDNDGNYEPKNARWATKREQANNRVTNKMFSFGGEEITFAELVRRTGLGKEFLRHRLLRAKWPLEKALSLPPCQGQRVNRVGA